MRRENPLSFGWSIGIELLIPLTSFSTSFKLIELVNLNFGIATLTSDFSSKYWTLCNEELSTLVSTSLRPSVFSGNTMYMANFPPCPIKNGWNQSFWSFESSWDHTTPYTASAIFSHPIRLTGSNNSRLCWPWMEFWTLHLSQDWNPLG